MRLTNLRLRFMLIATLRTAERRADMVEMVEGWKRTTVRCRRTHDQRPDFTRDASVPGSPVESVHRPQLHTLRVGHIAETGH